MSTSALSRKENGDATTSVHEIRSMMDLYDSYDCELIELARAARKKGWWRAYGLDDRGYVPMEAEASHVRDFELVYVPGLLQTENYARALFESAQLGWSATKLNNELMVRKLRQARLTHEQEPIELSAVVDEAVLCRNIGNPAVMREQLDYLVASTEIPTVSLNVLPLQAGAPSCLVSSFTVLSFPHPDDPDALYLEHPFGAVHSEDAPLVEEARLTFDRLRKTALNQQESVLLIKKLASAI